MWTGMDAPSVRIPDSYNLTLLKIDPFRYGGNFSCKVMQVLKQFSMTWNSFAVFVIGLGTISI